MDSLARNSLLPLHEKQTLNLEPWKEWYEKSNIIPATEWLANVMMNPTAADGWPVFKIDNPDLVSLLKLPDKGAINKTASIIPGTRSSRRSTPSTRKISACRASRPRIARPMRTASPSCSERLLLYAQLKNTVQPADAQDWPAELAAYEKLIPAGVAAVKAQQAGRNMTKPISMPSPPIIERFEFMSQLEPPLILPPKSARRNGGGWAMRCWTHRGDTPVDDAMHDYAKMAGALPNQPDCRFNAALQIMSHRSCRIFHGAGQSARGSFLQPDATVLQRDGHLRPCRPARRFSRGSICRKRCGARQSG